MKTMWRALQIKKLRKHSRQVMYRFGLRGLHFDARHQEMDEGLEFRLALMKMESAKSIGFKSALRNYCMLTGHGFGVIRDLGISRYHLREVARLGRVKGILYSAR